MEKWQVVRIENVSKHEIVGIMIPEHDVYVINLDDVEIRR